MHNNEGIAPATFKIMKSLPFRRVQWAKWLRRELLWPFFHYASTAKSPVVPLCPRCSLYHYKTVNHFLAFCPDSPWWPAWLGCFGMLRPLVLQWLLQANAQERLLAASAAIPQSLWTFLKENKKIPFCSVASVLKYMPNLWNRIHGHCSLQWTYQDGWIPPLGWESPLWKLRKSLSEGTKSKTPPPVAERMELSRTLNLPPLSSPPYEGKPPKPKRPTQEGQFQFYWPHCAIPELDRGMEYSLSSTCYITDMHSTRTVVRQYRGD